MRWVNSNTCLGDNFVCLFWPLPGLLPSDNEKGRRTRGKKVGGRSTLKGSREKKT